MINQSLKRIETKKTEAKIQEKLGGRVLLDESLKKYTTMKVGGLAQFFYRASSTADLLKAIQAALELKLPYFILGKGGNVVFSDQGFEGLVILNQADNISFNLEKAQATVDSGVANSRLVMEAAPLGLGGIEFLATIPGTLGGSVYNNAGAYGWEIGSLVKSISLLAVSSQTVSGQPKIRIEKKDRRFLAARYRSSCLKRVQHHLIQKAQGISWGSCQPIILSITLQLQRKSPENITQKIRELIKLRRSRQPQGLVSSGSTFKNPLGRASREAEVYQDIKKTAGYMLEQSGSKKMRVGDARVSQRHANFITHSGQATSQDIKDLVDKMQQAVEEKFDVRLEPEIEFVGKFD